MMMDSVYKNEGDGVVKSADAQGFTKKLGASNHSSPT
jgi:hypothetical protein